jgi:hypothetical protein
VLADRPQRFYAKARSRSTAGSTPARSRLLRASVPRSLRVARLVASRPALRLHDPLLTTSHPSFLPDTANRVETHLSHRKQKMGFPPTRHSSYAVLVSSVRPDWRPALCPSEPLALRHEGPTPKKEKRFFPPNFIRRRPSVRPESVSSLHLRISSVQNLIGTPERLETRLTRRK